MVEDSRETSLYCSWTSKTKAKYWNFHYKLHEIRTEVDIFTPTNFIVNNWIELSKKILNEIKNIWAMKFMRHQYLLSLSST